MHMLTRKVALVAIINPAPQPVFNDSSSFPQEPSGACWIGKSVVLSEISCCPSGVLWGTKGSRAGQEFDPNDSSSCYLNL